MNNFLIITGASRGIGKETAQLFVNAGWAVINLSRHLCEIPSVLNITVDLAADNWLESLPPIRPGNGLLKTLKSPAQISLVHNAAVNEKDSVNDLSARALRKILEVNLIAPVQLNQLLIPQMGPGSSIIYVGSTLSEKAVKNAASYVISKHALVGLMRSTCQDLAGTGIHTACVCPGFTDTEMLQAHVGYDQSVIASIENRVSAHRLIRPVEIAELIWFCANHEVINGSVLHANLGQIEH